MEGSRFLATPKATITPPTVYNALGSNTTGIGNTAIGISALSQNTTASGNTATGSSALTNNTIGDENVAVGASSLFSNSTGFRNTATGALALHDNDTGFDNTANGYEALSSNTTGANNTAIGALALQNSSTGDDNTANGVNALLASTTGNSNTAYGFGALFSNTSGSANIALGQAAGNNITTANNVIAIGSGGANMSNSCYIGQIYSNVQPVVGTDPDVVTINSDGRLGRANVSSRRYKHDIQPMEKSSEVLFALKPVSFRYHKQYDASQTLAFGLIAEEVAEVASDLVGRNEKSEPESVRYEQINAMLLNEFLKEHTRVEEQDRKIQEQEAIITQLKKDVDTLVARLKEHDSKIQRVTNRIETATSVSQMVLND
jgi:hypothetical protein